MKAPKKTVGLRLSESTTKELADLAKRHGVSQADVVAILVHWQATDGEDTDKIGEAFDMAARI